MKKVLHKNIFYFSLLSILACVSTFASTQVQNLSTPTETFKNYFKNTYEESDQHFTELFNKIKQYRPKSEIHEFQYSEGTIKSYFFPARKKQQNLLVLISGTHGIEAFAGSAVQRWFTDQVLNQELNQDIKLNPKLITRADSDTTAILMIHGFNLYGFKHFRRVNEHNIDLNRNFIISRKQFHPDDSKYTLLNSFLNPNNIPSTNLISQLSFFGNAVLNITQYSMESLRTSILKGQYSHPSGIFYGGTVEAIQSHLIKDLIQTYMKPYKKIFLVDLHTGYGERAKLHLLTGKSTDKNSVSLLKVFGQDEIDFADKKKFYAVDGELLSYFINEINLVCFAETTAVTFEYGTLDSQKITGSIDSLKRVILENQNFHHPAPVETSQEITSLYKEMFYPSDESWRLSIIQQTEGKMKKILNYLAVE